MTRRPLDMIDVAFGVLVALVKAYVVVLFTFAAISGLLFVIVGALDGAYRALGGRYSATVGASQEQGGPVPLGARPEPYFDVTKWQVPAPKSR